MRKLLLTLTIILLVTSVYIAPLMIRAFTYGNFEVGSTMPNQIYDYYKFDGVNDYLSRADDDVLDMGTSDFVLSSWIKTTNFDNNVRILQKRNDNTFYALHESGDAKVKFSIRSSLGVESGVTSDTNIADGQWHHILSIRDNDGNISLYVDGVSDATPVADVTASLDNAGNFDIGYTGYFNGQIATTRIFNFGKDGLPTGDDLTNLITGLYEKPNAPLSEYGLSRYADAERTEILNEGDFATHAKWTALLDWDDTGGNAHYQYSSQQISSLFQTAANRAVAGKGSVYYELTYTVAVTTPLVGGDIYIAGIFASAFEVIPSTAGTHKVVFLSNANAPTAIFYIQSQNAITAGDITLDDISIKRVGEVAHWKMADTSDETSNNNTLTENGGAHSWGEKVELGSQMRDAFTNGLQGYWSMDGQDISGTTITDISDNSNDGTITGAVGKAGKVGQALFFDGVDDYVSITNPSGLDTNAGAVSHWIKTGNSVDTMYSGSVAYTGGDSDFISMVRISSGEMTFYMKYGGAVNNMETGKNISDNQWHHILIQSDGSAYQIYIDGVEQTLNVIAGANNGKWLGDFANPVDNVSIGALTRTATVVYFDGLIDEVRIYNRALSTEEVLQQYNAGRGTFIGN